MHALIGKVPPPTNTPTSTACNRKRRHVQRRKPARDMGIFNAAQHARREDQQLIAQAVDSTGALTPPKEHAAGLEDAGPSAVAAGTLHPISTTPMASPPSHQVSAPGRQR
ncbi:hypothetical protein ACWCYZ_39780 [Streptomyces virginiae]